MQMGRFNPALPLCQYTGHLQRLFELAHVAGQRVGQQPLLRLRLSCSAGSIWASRFRISP
jgi:hypothetical protein